MKTKPAPHICFDRVLPRDKFRPFSLGHIGPMRLIAPKGKQWINGSVLSVRFIGGTGSQHSIVIEEARWITQHANIQFHFNDRPDATIRITFDENDGAWSYIGTDCAEIPQDQPTMNLGFLDRGTACHEFMHACGFSHEHQNPRGGIQWNEAAVIRDLQGPPNFWDVNTIRHNVLEKYSTDQIRGTEFDPKSIMMYWFPARWTLNGISTEANEELSETDKRFLAEMYPKPADPLVPVVTSKLLKPNHTRRTEASIGKPGEEDLFQFEVPASKEGRYVIDTRGNTNVVMRLFGPNSHTALLAEDDDSGIDLNASISRDLSAGHYFVQIRHSDQATGRGKYTIKVNYKPQRK